MAILDGRLNIVKMMINQGFYTLEEKDAFGLNALHKAAQTLNVGMVRWMLMRRPGLIKTRFRFGYTAFHAHLAETHQDLEMFRVLLSYDPEIHLQDSYFGPSWLDERSRKICRLLWHREFPPGFQKPPKRLPDPPSTLAFNSPEHSFFKACEAQRLPLVHEHLEKYYFGDSRSMKMCLLLCVLREDVMMLEMILSFFRVHKLPIIIYNWDDLDEILRLTSAERANLPQNEELAKESKYFLWGD